MTMAEMVSKINTMVRKIITRLKMVSTIHTMVCRTMTRLNVVSMTLTMVFKHSDQVEGGMRNCYQDLE